MPDWRRCLAASVLIAAVIGCGSAENDDGQEGERPFVGVKLRIAAPAGHDFGTIWRRGLDEWSARSGASTEFREYQIVQETGATTDRDLTTRDSATPLAERLRLDARDSPTLVVFPITKIAELAGDDRLAAIPEETQSAESLFWMDLFAGIRDGPATISGRAAILPLSAPVLVCYYRRDLFERERLSPAESWPEYQALLGALAEKNLAAVEPWDERFRATMFLARAVSYAKHPHQYSLYFDVETGQPLIDGPGFVRALEETGTTVRLMNQRHDVTRLSPADCRRLVLSGEAAMAVSFETGLKQAGAQSGSGRKTVDNEPDGEPSRRFQGLSEIPGFSIAFARLPGNPEAYNRSIMRWEPPRDERVNHCTLTAFGGLCAGVLGRASELEQAAAWNLLSQLAVEENNLVRVFPRETRGPCRESHLSRPHDWVGEALSGSEARQYLDVVARSLRDTRLVADLPVAGRARFRDALSEGIDRFLSGEADADEALHGVAEQWRRISAQIGPEKVLNSYRLCIGLRTKSDADGSGTAGQRP